MQIIIGNDTSFLSSIPLLTPKFFVQNKQAFAALVTSDEKQFASYSSDLGAVAIDFLYDPQFDRITGFLDVSTELVSNINNGIDIQKQWTLFEIFVRELYNDGNMHPFYYPLFVDVANAFRFRIHDAAGIPLREDIFALHGDALLTIKQRISALLDAQDRIEDPCEIIRCYHEAAFHSPLPIPNLQAEIISLPGQSPELAMVILPQSPEEIWNYLLPAYTMVGMRFKRCENCKRFFATTGRGNPKFCERIIEGTGKTCRQVMPKLNFYSKGETDPAVWLYNRAYKTMYSRVSVGSMKKDMFQEWAKRARQQRDACSKGEITPESYSAWLRDNGLHIDYLKNSK